MWLRQVVIFVAACLFAFASCAQQVDCAFVENSNFLISEWPPSGGLPEDSNAYFPALVKLHQLIPGTSTALLLRSFNQGSIGTSDAEQYWKLTIVVPPLHFEESFSTSLTNTIAHASRGGSAWVHNGSGFLSMATVGKVSVYRQSQNEVRVQLAAEFETQLVSEPTQRRVFKIEGAYKMHRLALESLTPWMGAIADAGDLQITYRKLEQTNCEVEKSTVDVNGSIVR